jgi:hypothetical protein
MVIAAVVVLSIILAFLLVVLTWVYKTRKTSGTPGSTGGTGATASSSTTSTISTMGAIRQALAPVTGWLGRHKIIFLWLFIAFTLWRCWADWKKNCMGFCSQSPAPRAAVVKKAASASPSSPPLTVQPPPQQETAKPRRKGVSPFGKGVPEESEKPNPAAPLPVPMHVQPTGSDKQKIVAFFQNSGLPPDDIRKMIQHAKDESDFHQTGKDGKPLRNDGLNKDGSVDIGAMQINSRWWPELDKMGPEYNVRTLEGNLNASMYIFRKQGHGAWTSARHTDADWWRRLVATVRETLTDKITITAPVGRWSEPYEHDGPIILSTDGPENDIEIMLDGDPTRIVRPGTGSDLGNAHVFQFRSRLKREVHVFIRF